MGKQKCFTDKDSDLAALVASWNKQADGKAGEQGGEWTLALDCSFLTVNLGAVNNIRWPSYIVHGD